MFRDTVITNAVLDGWAVTGIGELSQDELDGGVKILNAVRDKAKLSPNLATFTPDHLQALYVKGAAWRRLGPPSESLRRTPRGVGWWCGGGHCGGPSCTLGRRVAHRLARELSKTRAKLEPSRKKWR